MKQETKIYVLIDPNNLKIRYIGITCQSLIDRLGNHIHDAKYHPEFNRHKANWICSLLGKEQKPLIKQIALCNSRIEAEKFESELIIKYKDKHNLVNISTGNGEFTSKGQRSASELNSKKVYVYNYKGSYLGSYNSILDCSEELDICYSTIKKCLKGEYKYAKGFQFKFEYSESIPSLENYSTGSSKQITLLNNESGEILTFKSALDCKTQLKMQYNSTGIKYLIGALNKYYGNTYSILINGEFIQSTYYNTAVIIECANKEYKFKSKKDLLSYMGYKIKSIDESKLLDYIYKHFENIKDIKLHWPLCLVTGEDN